MVHRLVEKYGDRIKFVHRHLPLPNHQYALISAEAVEAAGEQGKFWELGDRLYAEQANLSEPMIYETARSLGLDMNRFKESLTQRRHARVIDADMEEAKRRSIRGTPTFFIGRAVIPGLPKWENMERAVLEELKRIENASQ